MRRFCSLFNGTYTGILHYASTNNSVIKFDCYPYHLRTFNFSRLFRCESNLSDISFVDSQIMKQVVRDCSEIMSGTATYEEKMNATSSLRKTLTKGKNNVLTRKVTLIPTNINNNHWVLCVLFNPKLCVSPENTLVQ